MNPLTLKFCLNKCGSLDKNTKDMWYRSLSLKLIVSLGLVIVAGIGTFAYVSLNNLREQLIDEVIVGATRISDTVKASTRYDMLINQRDALQNVIDTIGKQKSIEKVRIFNKEGVIMFSSHKEEMGLTVDKYGDTSCTACHVREKHMPLTELSTSQRTRIFDAKEGYRIVGMITPSTTNLIATPLVPTPIPISRRYWVYSISPCLSSRWTKILHRPRKGYSPFR